MSKVIKKNKLPKQEHYINENIVFSKLFVLKEDGSKLGVFDKEDAIKMAKKENLDLVLISINPKPIAKIMDYGKFKYNKKKKTKEEKAKQNNVENKQIKLTPLIGENDLKTKAKKTREFLLKGDMVKISVRFKGREIHRKDLGFKIIDEFYDLIEDIASKNGDYNTKNERFIDLLVFPDKKKIQKLKNQETKKEEQNAKNEN